MSSKPEVNVQGIGFFGLLAVALIVLKLMELVDVSWLVIVAVFLGPLWILLAALAVMGVALLIAAYLDRKR